MFNLAHGICRVVLQRLDCEQGKTQKVMSKLISAKQAFKLVQNFELCPTCFCDKPHDWPCNLQSKMPAEDDIDYMWPLKKPKV
jgi:hypothetical protein